MSSFDVAGIAAIIEEHHNLINTLNLKFSLTKISLSEDYNICQFITNKIKGKP